MRYLQYMVTALTATGIEEVECDGKASAKYADGSIKPVPLSDEVAREYGAFKNRPDVLHISIAGIGAPQPVATAATAAP
jgi:hypothetical protein